MAKLLQGYTHLLQPQNLLPNSNFSRGGGYPTTVTIPQMDSTHSWDSDTKGVFVTDEWRLQAQSCKLANVTVTRETNSLRVQGTMIYSDGVNWDRGCIILVSKLWVIKAGITYTFTCKVTDNLGTRRHFGLSSFNGNVYFNNETNGKLTLIKNCTVDGSPGLLIFIKGGYNVPFDITISDMAFYEGLYTNPPIIRSIDVLYNGILHNKDEFYVPREIYSSKFRVLGSGKWTRILKIRAMFVKRSTNYVVPYGSWYIKGILIKGYSQAGSNVNNHNYASYIFEVWTSLSGSSMNKNYVSFNVSTVVPNDGQPLNQWRITCDPVSDRYGGIDGYIECGAHSQMKDTNNTSQVYIFDNVFGFSSDSHTPHIEYNYDPIQSPSDALLVGSAVTPTSVSTIVSGSASVVL